MQPPSDAGFVTVRDPRGRVSALSGACIAIGNFDGVHRGHQAVLARVRAAAAGHGAPAVALTFEPHPRTFFAPEKPLFRLTPDPVKRALFARFGLDGALVLTFDAGLAGMEAEDFVVRYLIEAVSARHVCVGRDFHFGRARRGTPAFLAEAGEAGGFTLEVVEPYKGADGITISSSAVRAALAEGDVAVANALLGYDWFVEGEVAHGDKRGRTLGYPTANLVLPPETDLRHGIYAVRVEVEGARYDGVASFGRRPTFDDGAPRLEAHLFAFSGDLYGRRVRVELAGFIRPEERFDGAEALIAAMDADAGAARALLSATA